MFFCEVGSGRRDKVRRLLHGVVLLRGLARSE